MKYHTKVNNDLLNRAFEARELSWENLLDSCEKGNFNIAKEEFMTIINDLKEYATLDYDISPQAITSEQWRIAFENMASITNDILRSSYTCNNEYISKKLQHIIKNLEPK
jgi:hypothetical protein